MELIALMLSLIVHSTTVISADSRFLGGNSAFNAETFKELAVEWTILEDCNLNADSYKKWIGKINSYNCINCYDEFIVGNSMNPTLKSYDSLVFDRNRTAIEGDIIEYDKTKEKSGVTYSWTKNNNIIHRVVAMQGDDFVVLGDNNPGPCELIPSDAVFGVLAG